MDGEKLAQNLWTFIQQITIFISSWLVNLKTTQDQAISSLFGPQSYKGIDMSMQKKFEKVGLENIGRGAAGELFDTELQRVLANIEDINTDATKVRKITLEVTLKPDRERETCEVTIASKAALAPITPALSKINIGRDGVKIAAYEAVAQDTPDNVAKLGEC